MEKQLIQFVLQQAGWHKGNAAKILQINRSTLYNKIREYDIERA
jgi:DNA-binding NtrC family response regulator